jgi:methylated-DNA-[protein]-cysteine S-methyltransferase
MKHRRTILPCGFREEVLIAAALDEADAPRQQAVQSHIASCPACRGMFATYGNLQQVFLRLQESSPADSTIRQAKDRLMHALSPAITQRLRYRQVESGLGALYIARSARGVPLVAWRDKATQLLASLDGQEDVAVQADGEEFHQLVTELHAYFAGSRTRFSWPIDEMLVRSDFQRHVLRVTAEIPYGAVMSYQGIAAALGQPKAVRAVAQALRRNPVAIVIPCHRVVGRTGHLTGYAGGLDRKRALLAHEGVPLVARSSGVFIDKTHMYVGWRAERAYCKPQCPSLVSLPPGDMLLISPVALGSQGDFVPCDVCHPEVVSA